VPLRGKCYVTLLCSAKLYYLVTEVQWCEQFAQVCCESQRDYIAVAAQGCLAPGANVFIATPTPAIRSPTDILMITTMALVWTVNSMLSWGCNYVMQWNLG